MLLDRPSQPAVALRDPVYLAAADGIGRTIARDAVWADGRCTWIVGALEPDTMGSFVPVFRSAGPDLYGGLAGIAFFLTFLEQLAGDADLAAVRDGALSQLAYKVETVAPYGGAYGGPLGGGWALARLGAVTGNASLVTRGLAAVERLAAMPAPPEAVDIIGGRAGSIQLLLDLGRRFGRADLIDAARRCGDELIAGAVVDDTGTSWTTHVAGLASKNLVGYGHGVAGIALALFELASAVNDERYGATARDALRYERATFDPVRRNWPDFRLMPNMPPPAEPMYSVAWCHGATGVGLARLRTAALLKEDAAMRTEIDCALETVSRTASAQLATAEPFDMTPCHGLTGSIELGIEYAARYGRPDARAFADAVARTAIERYHLVDAPWTCGVKDVGETFGLMLGTAGIGYGLLRAYDAAAVPSLLVITPPNEVSI